MRIDIFNRQFVSGGIFSGLSALNGPVSVKPVGDRTVIVPQPGCIYHGFFPGSPVTAQKVDAFESMSGQKIDIALEFLSFKYIDKWDHFPWDEFQMISSRNAVPMLTLESFDPDDATNNDYSLENIVAGKCDQIIEKVANKVKAFDKPMFIRYGHEMNVKGDGKYPWADADPALYIAAYQRVKDIFDRTGANKVTWVWCPNIDFPGSTKYYPGDSYVDWVAMDGYNTLDEQHTWRSPEELFKPLLDELSGLGKPMMIGETATPDDPRKAAWLWDLVEFTVKSGISGYVYFDSDKEKEWKIDTLGDQGAYRDKLTLEKDHLACDITTGTEEPCSVPTRPEIYQNYPNPFSGSTSITFAIPKRAETRVQIFDSMGRLVRQVHSGQMEQGRHEVVWNGKSSAGTDMPSGMYLCRVQTGSSVLTLKLTKAK